MNWLLAPVTHEFMQRALLGALLAGGLNGFLGTWIILRRWSLATDALSHALFPGLALAALLFGSSPLALLVGGVASAVFVSGSAEIVSRSSRIKPDAALAILYPFAYAAGLVVISLGGIRVNVSHWLFGNILGLGSSDLWMLWAGAAVIIPLFIALERSLLLATFEPLVAASSGVPIGIISGIFAFSVVLAACISFRAAGVVPMVALMLAPAATMRLLTDRVPVMIWGATTLGGAGAIGGLWIAHLANLSGASAIALLLGSIFLAVYVAAPQHGIIARMRRREHYCAESFRRWHLPFSGRKTTSPTRPSEQASSLVSTSR